MKHLCLFILYVAIPISTFAQNELKTQTAATYTTDLDKELSIKSFTVLPSSDNTGGIYARPIEEEIKPLIQKDHRFQLVDSQFVGSMVTPEDLESNPDQVKQILENINTDAAIASKVSKGPDGMNFHVSLFLKSDGKLIAHEVVKEKNTFDIKQTRAKVSEITQRLIKMIPYDGFVMSRNQTVVTINLGKKNGLQPGQVVTAILLIKANRHPKLNFLISTDKEVLGKIRLDKVDDSLSFGQILTEKDFGTIQKGTKISGIDFVKHSSSPLGESFKESPENSKMKEMTFGENPKEWVPSAPPSFGKIGVNAGFGKARYNSTTATTSATVDDGFYIPVKILGEIWLTSQWIGDVEIEQGITTGDPNLNISNYLLAFGYNFLVQDDFFGPSVLISLGFSSYGVDVESSTNLSSTKYSGVFLRLKGYVPISDDKKWNLGGMLQYHLVANYNDTPNSGGSDDNTITKFSLLGYYQLNPKFRYTSSLDFSAFSTKFTGSTVRQDTSQKFTTLTGGLEYLF